MATHLDVSCGTHDTTWSSPYIREITPSWSRVSGSREVVEHDRNVFALCDPPPGRWQKADITATTPRDICPVGLQWGRPMGSVPGSRADSSLLRGTRSLDVTAPRTVFSENAATVTLTTDHHQGCSMIDRYVVRHVRGGVRRTHHTVLSCL